MSVVSYTKAKIDTLLGSKQDTSTLDANLAAAVTPGGSATAAAIAADPVLRAALVPRPDGGTDGQVLVKSGTDVIWSSPATAPYDGGMVA